MKHTQKYDMMIDGIVVSKIKLATNDKLRMD